VISPNTGSAQPAGCIGRGRTRAPPQPSSKFRVLRHPRRSQAAGEVGLSEPPTSDDVWGLKHELEIVSRCHAALSTRADDVKHHCTFLSSGFGLPYGENIDPQSLGRSHRLEAVSETPCKPCRTWLSTSGAAAIFRAVLGEKLDRRREFAALRLTAGAHAACDPLEENPRRIETVAAHFRSSSAIGLSQSASNVLEGPIAVITRASEPE
jgi:hypothetical protein